MADKCFCHLNGYEVKDATARNDIAELKREKTTTFIIHNKLIKNGGYYYSGTLTIKPIVKGSVHNSKHIEIVSGETATITVPVGTLVLGYTDGEFPNGIKVYPTDRGNGDAYSWESADGTLTLFADSEGTREYNVQNWTLSNTRRPKVNVTLHNELNTYNTPASSGTITYLIYDPMNTEKVGEKTLAIGNEVTLTVHAGSLIVVRPSNNYPKWICTEGNLYSVATPDTLFIKIPRSDGNLEISIIEKSVTTAQERVRLEEEARKQAIENVSVRLDDVSATANGSMEGVTDLYNQFSSLETENVSLRNTIANLTYQIDLLKTRVTTLEEDAYDGGQSGEPGDDGVTVIVPIYNRTNASATVKYYDQHGVQQTETVVNGTGNQKSVYAKIGTDLIINGSGIASITAPFEVTSFSDTSVKMSVHQTGVIANDVVIYSDDSGDYPPESSSSETIEYNVISYLPGETLTCNYTDGTGASASAEVTYNEDGFPTTIQPAINTVVEVVSSGNSIRGVNAIGLEPDLVTANKVAVTIRQTSSTDGVGIIVGGADFINEAYNQVDSTGTVTNNVTQYASGDGEVVTFDVGVMGSKSIIVGYTDEAGGTETLNLDPGDTEAISVLPDTELTVSFDNADGSAVTRVTAIGLTCVKREIVDSREVYTLMVVSTMSDVNTEVLAIGETI